MPKRSVPLLFIGALLLAAVVRVALVWNELPDVMASHFGAAGRPDGWQGKTAFFATFAGIFGFTLWVLLLIGKLVQHVPLRLINLPYRDYWLTPERMPEAMARLTSSMDWLSVAMTMLLTSTLELTIQANITRQPLDNTSMFVLLIGFFVFNIGWLIHLFRRFKPA